MHRRVFGDLVLRSGWTRGAELGLGHGHLFGLLLETCPGLFLIGVDHFRRGWEPYVRAIAERYPTRCQVIGKTTHAAAADVADRSLDFVFIDAGHRRQDVADDIARWRSKVKAGGWFGGHDYQPGHPGVVAAVNAAYGAHVQTLPGAIWWVTA